MNTISIKSMALMALFTTAINISTLLATNTEDEQHPNETLTNETVTTALQTLDPQITKFIWHGRSLTGWIPDALGNFVNLKNINLSRNQIEGVIPQSIGNLKQLEGLDLSENRLEGEIPQEIGALENLKYLYLSDNKLCGVIPDNLLKNIVKLGNVLDLSDNFFAEENKDELLKIHDRFKNVFPVGYRFICQIDNAFQPLIPVKNANK